MSGPLWADPQNVVHEGGTIDAVIDLRQNPPLYAIDTWPIGVPWTVNSLFAPRRTRDER